MEKTEVTQKQWQVIMGNNPSSFKCEDCPVENVSRNKAQEFIQKLNKLTGKKYSLPSEAQWEFAARGGTKSKGYKYAGSNDLGEVAWYDDNSDGKMHEVGKRMANELGLYDMNGNVWEWCQDYYNSDFYSNIKSKNNPINKIGKELIVLRGGCWNSPCRVADRYNGYEDDFSRCIGFRVCSFL
jgi:formylglycine-generating enzyme required for sulfatase activity